MEADGRVKRARDKKTRRAKTIKQLTAMGRRHLLGVRVVMKNMVYVTGMKIPGSGDEVSRALLINGHSDNGVSLRMPRLTFRQSRYSAQTTTLASTAKSPNSTSPTAQPCPPQLSTPWILQNHPLPRPESTSSMFAEKMQRER